MPNRIRVKFLQDDSYTYYRLFGHPFGLGSLYPTALS